jgi:hypothetical protein
MILFPLAKQLRVASMKMNMLSIDLHQALVIDGDGTTVVVGGGGDMLLLFITVVVSDEDDGVLMSVISAAALLAFKIRCCRRR